MATVRTHTVYSAYRSGFIITIIITIMHRRRMRLILLPARALEAEAAMAGLHAATAAALQAAEVFSAAAEAASAEQAEVRAALAEAEASAVSEAAVHEAAEQAEVIDFKLKFNGKKLRCGANKRCTSIFIFYFDVLHKFCLSSSCLYTNGLNVHIMVFYIHKRILSGGKR